MSDVSIDPTIRRKAEKIIESNNKRLEIIDEEHALVDDEVARLNIRNL